jgi:hypothetical protein
VAVRGAPEEPVVGMSLLSGADGPAGAGEAPPLAAADASVVCAVFCSFLLLTACIAQITTISSNAPAASVLQDTRCRRLSSSAHHCWQNSLLG